MSKPFFYKIDAAEFMSAVFQIPEGKHKEWISQLAIDLVAGQGTIDYSCKLIQEVEDYRRKQAEFGAKGGKPKHKAPHTDPIGTLTDPIPTPKLPLPNSSNNNNKPKPYSIEFESFWEVYPWKTAKGKAWDSWQKANPPLSTVLSALEWQCKSEKWTKDNGEYIPMPATYINQKRWEDKPLSIVAKSDSQKGYGYAY